MLGVEEFVVSKEEEGMDSSPLFRISKPKPVSQLMEDIEISISLEWPLNMIIDSALIRKYNVLFRSLLRLKRAKHCLQKDFFSSSIRKTWDVISKDPLLHPVQQKLFSLRVKLTHFVDSLIHYHMERIEDVCENSFNEEHVLTECKDLSQLKKLFEHNINSLLNKCFLSDKTSSSVGSSLNQITSVCQVFQEIYHSFFSQCIFIKGNEQREGSLSFANNCLQAISKIESDFEQRNKFFLSLLSRITANKTRTRQKKLSSNPCNLPFFLFQPSLT